MPHSQLLNYVARENAANSKRQVNRCKTVESHITEVIVSQYLGCQILSSVEGSKYQKEAKTEYQKSV